MPNNILHLQNNTTQPTDKNIGAMYDRRLIWNPRIKQIVDKIEAKQINFTLFYHQTVK